jgi:hypothetical protein
MHIQARLRCAEPFEPLAAELDKIAAAAWNAYDGHRKSPRTRKAGGEFADPNYWRRAPPLQMRGAVTTSALRRLFF